jgi:hypothetical protein
LAKELTLTEPNITDFSILQKKDTPYDLFQKVTYVNKSAIISTLASIDRKELGNAIEVLKKTRESFFLEWQVRQLRLMMGTINLQSLVIIQSCPMIFITYYR